MLHVVKAWLVAILLVAACKAPAAIPLDAPASPWSMGSNLPIPRLEPGVAALGESIVVVGGWDTGVEAGLQVTTRVDVYDTTQDTWSQLPDAPVARHHVQLATIGTTVYLLGGLDGTADVNNDYPARGDCYAIDTGTPNATWQPIAPIPTGFERGSAGVVVTPPRVYLLGGASTTDAIASNIFYDSIADAWTTGALPDLPTARSHPAAMRRASDGTFIVVGGLAGLASDTAEADVYWLTSDQQTSAGTWVSKTPMPEERGGCAYGVVQDQLLCAGGEAGMSALTYMQGYDSINDVWNSYPYLPSPRAGVQGAAVADALYVVGGAEALVFEPTDSLYIFSLDDTAPAS
jgi:N-acetylneuraminic acid mutarotase